MATTVPGEPRGCVDGPEPEPQTFCSEQSGPLEGRRKLARWDGRRVRFACWVRNADLIILDGLCWSPGRTVVVVLSGGYD